MSQYQFSTLEKTKRGHHPTLKNLLKKNFPLIVHDNSNQKLSISLCRHQVVPILPLSQQLYFRILIFIPWSIFRNNRIPRIVFSAVSLLRSYWSRRWHVRWHLCDKAHQWSRFCCDSFFSWILFKSFRNCFKANCWIEMADIEHAQQMIPFVTCEFLFVGKTTSWIWVSMYLIWIFGSKLIRSNNQSSATLWVLEKCLIVLQTNTTKASWCEDWTFEGTQSMWSNTLVVPWDLGFLSLTTCLSELSEVGIVFPRTETIRSHKSRKGIPSNLTPASKEMILLNCVKLKFVSYISKLIGIKIWLPKMHNVPPEVDFEFSRSPAKTESWNSPNLYYFAVTPTKQFCLSSQMWWMWEINRLKNWTIL